MQLLSNIPTPPSTLLGNFAGQNGGEAIQNSNNSNPPPDGFHSEQRADGQRQQTNNPFSAANHNHNHDNISPFSPRNPDQQGDVSVQQQEVAYVDRLRLANILLKHQLLGIGSAAYNEFLVCLRLWGDAVGAKDDDAEPMDWQPEKETPVHSIVMQPEPLHSSYSPPVVLDPEEVLIT